MSQQGALAPNPSLKVLHARHRSEFLTLFENADEEWSLSDLLKAAGEMKEIDTPRNETQVRPRKIKTSNSYRCRSVNQMQPKHSVPISICHYLDAKGPSLPHQQQIIKQINGLLGAKKNNKFIRSYMGSRHSATQSTTLHPQPARLHWKQKMSIEYPKFQSVNLEPSPYKPIRENSNLSSMILRNYHSKCRKYIKRPEPASRRSLINQHRTICVESDRLELGESLQARKIVLSQGKRQKGRTQRDNSM